MNRDSTQGTQKAKDEPRDGDGANAYKTRLGLKLFVVYCLIYAGFVGINTVNPELMETLVFSGLNLAVVYGVGLILIAVIMGLVYNYLCTRAEDRLAEEQQEKSGDDS